MCLDTPIENNYFFCNTFGVGEYGTHLTDIKNNVIYGSYYDSIEAYMESYEGAADANRHILIQNNTCDYQYDGKYDGDGITIHGTADANDAGTVVLINNIVSKSYVYGMRLGKYSNI